MKFDSLLEEIKKDIPSKMKQKGIFFVDLDKNVAFTQINETNWTQILTKCEQEGVVTLYVQTIFSIDHSQVNNLHSHKRKTNGYFMIMKKFTIAMKTL